jgi:phosphoribosylformimino-5-aminoimidazole carboxamide ribotide isomerase
MLIIPAIDLKGGKCVRLYQGKMDKATVYADNPAEMARRWQEAGAERLHIVDLDGAVSGVRVNAEALAAICQAVTMPIEVGGGIRNLQAIEQVLDLGVKWVILGTVACREPQVVAEACENFPGRILVGIDAREGKVAVSGWTETTEMTALTLAGRCADLGVKEIIYTDISRDGTQAGVNAAATAALARAISIPVIASGGVASLEDIRRLRGVEQDGVTGVIIGRALYTGAIKLEEAIKEAQAGDRQGSSG